MALEQLGQAPAKRIDCPIKSGPSDFSRLVMEKVLRCEFDHFQLAKLPTRLIFGKRDSFVKLLSDFKSR